MIKSSIRELAVGAVNRKNVGTTIAATSCLAHRVELSTAVLVGNPVPVDEQLDPSLLEFIRQATGDASLNSNVALYRNNARLAAQIAVALEATTGST